MNEVFCVPLWNHLMPDVKRYSHAPVNEVIMTGLNFETVESDDE